MSAFEAIADVVASGTGTRRILVGLILLLAGATLLRAVRLLRTSNDQTRQRWHSIGTWWGLFAAFAAAVLLGRTAVTAGMAIISLLGLHEGLRLARARSLYPLLALATASLYLWAWLDWTSLFLQVLPAAGAVLGLAEIVWRLRARPRLVRLRAAGLAALLAVLGPSFAVAVASLPAPEEMPDETLGWFVLLLILTEINDAAQAWWGRSFGSRPLAPVLSPGKTLEGLLGGVATTALAAMILAPLVTSYGQVSLQGGGALPPRIGALPIGLIVGFAGIIGDLAVSSLKRHAGKKDSGRVLPGQGGILDRFDSLATTAPAFFLVTWLFWFHGS